MMMNKKKDQNYEGQFYLKWIESLDSRRSK